jgi:hypothetical protein
MENLNTSSDTYAWMHYLSPTAKSMLFALPLFIGFSSVLDEHEEDLTV